MSKSDKLLLRLRSVPADFTWSELVTALRGLGFRDISDKPGSYRTFANVAGRKIFLHEPHPSNILKKYALRKVIAALDDLGL